MGENTKIQWAHHTFNPWRGCTKIATGCANCYADAQSKRNPKTLGIWGPNGTRVVASEAMWREPLKWSKVAASLPDTIVRPGSLPVEHIPVERLRVFCASLADVFEDWRMPVVNSRGEQLFVHADGTMDYEQHGKQASLSDVRARLFRLIDSTPNLDWLLLTKRPENIRRMWCSHVNTDGRPPSRLRRDNVWLGTSIACQEDADRNIPELLNCRNLAAKLFLSIEPLVGPVDISSWIGCFHESSDPNQDDHAECAATANWVIVGGESGPNARPCDVAWIRSIVRQCKDAGVPVFVKQLGAKPFVDGSGGERFGWPCGFEVRGGQTWLRLRDTKGGDPSEWPEDLRVREVPS